MNFITVTDFDTNEKLLINLNQVKYVRQHKFKNEVKIIFTDASSGCGYFVVKESMEEIMEQITNGWTNWQKEG